MNMSLEGGHRRHEGMKASVNEAPNRTSEMEEDMEDETLEPTIREAGVRAIPETSTRASLALAESGIMHDVESLGTKVEAINEDERDQVAIENGILDLEKKLAKGEDANTLLEIVLGKLDVVEDALDDQLVDLQESEHKKLELEKMVLDAQADWLENLLDQEKPEYKKAA